jgi:SNF2 family DNA or RNA helicase
LTGKTLTAIAVAGRLFLDGKVRRLLVVGPKSVVPVWAGNKKLNIPGQIDEYAGFPYEVESFLGNVNKRIDKLLSWKHSDRLQCAVWNYDAIRDESVKTAIYKWKPDLIIADEAQRIGNPSSQQSKALYWLGDRTPYRMALTGTPVRNSPLDYFGIYRFVNPSIFGKSFTAFKARYAVMGGYQNYQIVGYKNMEELVQKAHSQAFRVTKRECLDLDPVLHQKLYCQLEPSARKQYHDMAKHSVIELEQSEKVIAINVLSRMEKLAQVAGGFVKNSNDKWVQISKAKINLLKETLKDLLLQGKKVIVFAIHVPELDAIEQLLTEMGIDFVHIRGMVSDNERDLAKYRFQNDTNCKVFVGQTHASGLGIDLFASHNVIFYSKNHSYDDFDQAVSRADRNGQKYRVNAIHLIAEDTIDEKITESVKNKENIADMVVNRWREWIA